MEKFNLEIFTLNDVIKITGQKREVVKSIAHKAGKSEETISTEEQILFSERN
ncbi:MAG: hypothetical protein U5Q03_01855 [Bacteroidota bacterium]|nr:hypothetical protein [Bacteroidota bacterium]